MDVNNLNNVANLNDILKEFEISDVCKCVGNIICNFCILEFLSSHDSMQKICDGSCENLQTTVHAKKVKINLHRSGPQFRVFPGDNFIKLFIKTRHIYKNTYKLFNYNIFESITTEFILYDDVRDLYKYLHAENCLLEYFNIFNAVFNINITRFILDDDVTNPKIDYQKYIDMYELKIAKYDKDTLYNILLISPYIGYVDILKMKLAFRNNYLEKLRKDYKFLGEEAIKEYFAEFGNDKQNAKNTIMEIVSEQINKIING